MKSFVVWLESQATKKFPKKIKKFHEKLASYKWGMVNGDLKPIGTDEFEKYRTLSPGNFHELQRGTCWDYVEAQRDWYDSQNIPNEVYYLQLDNHEHASHTVIIVKDRDGYLWDEASWKVEQGLHRGRDKDELLAKIAKKHQETEPEGVDGVSIWKYEHPPYPQTGAQFMSWVKKHGERIVLGN